MDAFYAAVEQLDNPVLRGKPVLVGPNSRRGVVLTASYEARPYNVGSAMPMARAVRLCPDAVVVPPRFDRYEEVSVSIMKVFSDFSPDVEPLSLDEAFLEMSGAEDLFGSPRSMGQRLREAVREATGGLTVSVGLSGTKYVAKVASAHRKPDGLTLVAPARARAWLAPQSIARLWGAGAKMQAKLRGLGFETIGDVAAADKEYLVEQLGSVGAHFYNLSHAHDPRPVLRHRGSKSIGSEQTLRRDISSDEEIRAHLRRAADKIGKRLRRKGLVAGGVRVKLKTSAFRLLTRQSSLKEPSDLADTLYAAGADLLRQFDDAGPFRLVGMAAFALTSVEDPQQLELLGNSARQRRLETTLDEIADRFGDDMVRRAAALPRTLEPRLSSDIDFLDGPDPD
jgi:DNA polymerase-4